MDTEQAQNLETQNNYKTPSLDLIIDLPRLSVQKTITHSDIILSILEICTFNKKYNYDCSNNTKAFWDRVVEEGILKKIFKDFKSETLRKYWKIIRQTGDNDKFLEVVRQNQKFINNPVFKLLPIINTISTYITTPPKNQNFQEYFIEINPKETKELHKKEPSPEKKEKKPKIKKTEKKEKIEKEENDSEYIDPKIVEMDDIIEKLMKITNASKENVYRALHGCTGDIKKAYLYLKDNQKYDNYFYSKSDDYIIKNLKNKNLYIQLINKKGEESVKEREKFLKKNKH